MYEYSFCHYITYLFFVLQLFLLSKTLDNLKYIYQIVKWLLIIT